MVKVLCVLIRPSPPSMKNIYIERDRDRQTERCRDTERQRYFHYSPGALKSLIKKKKKFRLWTSFDYSKTSLCSPSRKLSLSSRRKQLIFLGIFGIPLPIKPLFLRNHIRLEQGSSGLWYGYFQFMKFPRSTQAWRGSRSHFFNLHTYTFPKLPCLNAPVLEMFSLSTSSFLARRSPLKKESLILTSPHLTVVHWPRVEEFWTQTKGTIQNISV